MPVFADILPEPGMDYVKPIDFNIDLNESIDSVTVPSWMLWETSISVWILWWISTIQLIYYWIIWIFSIVCMWIIFKKAGRKWRESIIPVWNIYVLCKIIWKKNRFWIFIWPAIAWLLRIIISFILRAIWGWWELWAAIANALNWIIWIASMILFVLAMIFGIMSYFRLSKKFGKSWWFGVWLLFLTPIFLWILAFWKAQYQWEEE